MLAPHASEIWTKSYGPNYTKCELFDKKKKKKKKKKKGGLYHFSQSVDDILEDVSVPETII